MALVKAAGAGAEAVVKLLLMSVDGPTADCLGGTALVEAAGGGHKGVAQMVSFGAHGVLGSTPGPGSPLP